MKKITAMAALSALALAANGQNEVDALRYSFLTFGGPARSVSMGGSFGALGADFSSLSVNPAGIGLYRKNEFTFTPSFFHQRSTANYNASEATDDKYNFNFSNIGVVIGGRTFDAYDEADKPGWKRIYLGFGYNRLANFHNRVFISGKNNQSTLLNVFANESMGLSYNSLDQFGAQLAFDTWLLDTMPGNPTSYSTAIPNGDLIEQSKTIESRGAYGETVLTLAGNYSDKLFIGGSFAFPHVKYIEESSYTEKEIVDSTSSFRSYTYNQDINTRGNGFNFKLGIIYKLTDWVRIGGAIHTPTLLNLSDTYTYEIKSEFDDGSNYNATSPNGSFNYSLTTPMRAIGSLGFIVGKYGALNLDYEYVDYSYARLRSSPNVFVEQNKTIHNKYTATANVRVGAEIKLKPVTLRGGWAYYGSPYRSNINDGSRMNYTGGIGFREDNYFVDLAYVYSTAREDYYLYDPENTKPATIDSKQTNFMVTVGFRF